MLSEGLKFKVNNTHCWPLGHILLQSQCIQGLIINTACNAFLSECKHACNPLIQGHVWGFFASQRQMRDGEKTGNKCEARRLTNPDRYSRKRRHTVL